MPAGHLHSVSCLLLDLEGAESVELCHRRGVGQDRAKIVARAETLYVLGVLAAFALRRTIEGFLFEVPSWDPLSFLAGAIGLAAIALGGSWLPALRAARIESAEIMRDG